MNTISLADNVNPMYEESAHIHSRKGIMVERQSNSDMVKFPVSGL